jgi:hypothetical protein
MPDSGTQSEYWDPHHNELSEGGVTVAEFQTEEECNFAVYLLGEGGVRSSVIIPERRLDLRLPQVKVAPDDEALARRILAQPITADKRAQYDVPGPAGIETWEDDDCAEANAGISKQHERV